MFTSDNVHYVKYATSRFVPAAALLHLLPPAEEGLNGTPAPPWTQRRDSPRLASSLVDEI